MDQGEPARLGGELAGVRVSAHAGRLVGTGASGYEAAGQQLVAGHLTDRLGLPGQQ